METTNLFTAALGLEKPWEVRKVEFQQKDNELELHIEISFAKGSSFDCPVDGCTERAGAYDTTERTWRHLDFFQYKTYIHARVPRVDCKIHGPHTVKVPWARKGSGFTLLFESWVVELAKHISVSKIASMVGENDTRLWPFIRHYVRDARLLADYSKTTAVGIDETSKKGHNYITVVADLIEKKVIHVASGKDSSTVNGFAEDFKEHNGKAENISVVTCDMSLGFQKGIRENFPNSSMIIDKFHVIKHANEAVDAVRKKEVKDHPILKGTKYLWLKNKDNLTDKQISKKESLCKKRLKTSRAYAMRLALQEIYQTAKDYEQAEQALKKLCSWMMRSRLDDMKQLAKMIRRHWTEILNYFKYRFTNALMEGLNSIIQNVKRRARGFRNDEYFKTMIFLSCGKLNLETSALRV